MRILPNGLCVDFRWVDRTDRCQWRRRWFTLVCGLMSRLQRLLCTQGASSAGLLLATENAEGCSSEGNAIRNQ